MSSSEVPDPPAKPELVLLGTGTSTGVPMPGCDYDSLDLSDPRDWRTRSSAYLAGPEGCLLIDTTPDFWHQAHRERIRRVDAVLYTHAHADHILGFDDLRRFCVMNESSMPVYGSVETLADIRRIFFYAFGEKPGSYGYIHATPHAVASTFLLLGWEITPLAVPHGQITTYGYLFQRDGIKWLAYLSDAAEVPEQQRRMLDGVRHLVIDGLREKPHPTHLSIPESLEIAREVKAENTYLTHLTGHRTHQKRADDLPSDIQVCIAYDGLRIPLS